MVKISLTQKELSHILIALNDLTSMSESFIMHYKKNKDNFKLENEINTIHEVSLLSTKLERLNNELSTKNI